MLELKYNIITGLQYTFCPVIEVRTSKRKKRIKNTHYENSKRRD